MLALLVVAWSAFGWSAIRRWQLLRTGQPAARFDRIGERLLGTWRYALRAGEDGLLPARRARSQAHLRRLRRAPPPHAHALGARLRPDVQPLRPRARAMPLGQASTSSRRTSSRSLVVGGVCVFVYYRVVKPQKRMTLQLRGRSSSSGIIVTMMLADMIYDGAALVLLARKAELCGDGQAARSRRPRSATRFATIVAPLGEQVEPHGSTSSGRRSRRPRARSSRSLFTKLSARARSCRSRTSASGRTRRSSSSS